MAPQRGGERKALDELVREARKEQLTELDWEALEGRLLHRATEQSRTPRRSRQFVVSALAAALITAVLAVIGVRAGLLSSGSQPEVRRVSEPVAVAANQTPAPRTFGPDVTSPLDGNALAAGDRVQTRALPIRVQHRSHSGWVLAADSAATVLSVGDVVTLRLDAGTLHAEVTPAERPESFIVHAGGTRVAVHGTRFKVQRRHGRVLVRVTEGVVVVSPLRDSGPADERWLLRAPSRGDFSEDGSAGHVIASEGASAAAPLQRSRPARRPQVRAPVQTPPIAREAEQPVATVQPAEPAESQDAPPAEEGSELAGAEGGAPYELPLKPSIGEVEAGLTRVIDSLSACFQEHMPARGDVRVTARTKLMLGILADGRIGSAVFDPPLAPNVSQCAVSAAAHVRFAASREGVRLTRFLELRR
ncbi:MAG TPA: FecR domain-containing protein [Polyangiaceae bacterium]|nr:FecR domain-containing protein [Polyangiaceae bacterium]